MEKNIKLSSTPRHPEWSLPFRFTDWNFVFISYFTDGYYMHLPYHSTWLDNPSNIWWRAEIIKFIIWFCPVSCYSSLRWILYLFISGLYKWRFGINDKDWGPIDSRVTECAPGLRFSQSGAKIVTAMSCSFANCIFAVLLLHLRFVYDHSVCHVHNLNVNFISSGVCPSLGLARFLYSFILDCFPAL
jgi:hypothetical protein